MPTRPLKNSRVKIYTQRVKQLEKAAITALEHTAEYIHTDVVQSQVVPRESGALQNEKMFVDYSKRNDGKVSINFEGPYARRLYYHQEYHFNKEANSNAKGKWMEDYTPSGDKYDNVKKAYANFYRKATKI